MAEATTDIEQLMNDYEDLWNGDFSKLEVVSESVDIYDPGMPDGEGHGRDELKAYISELQTGFPDFQLTIDDWIASGDVVMLQWTTTGTHEGEFNDIPPTEREVNITGMLKLQIADGKVQKHRGYWDRQEMFEQLGLTEE